MSQKFQVGDLVIGNSRSDREYLITDSHRICEVVEVRNLSMRVKIRGNAPGFEMYDSYSNKLFDVDCDFFDHYYESNEDEISLSSDEEVEGLLI